jgi:predicted RNase H-like HicB family nuclease
VRISAISKNLFRLDLRVVFYQESGFWVAHCLEMDVLGHGPDQETATENLAEAIGTQIEQSLQNGNPANVIQLADRKYFEMFFSGNDKAQLEVTCIAKEIRKAIRKSDRIQVDDIKGREFLAPALV